MPNVYGKPFDREAQISRGLRRGRPGLMAGRSEAALPSRFRRGRRVEKGEDGAIGPSGAPGSPNIEDPLIRGNHEWLIGSAATAIGRVSAQFNMQASNLIRGTVVPWPGVTFGDFGGSVPYHSVRSASTANDRATLGVGTGFQLGQGNGRGGFLVVCQFGLAAPMPANANWLMCLSVAEPSGYAQSFGGQWANMVGVGAPSGASVVSFVQGLPAPPGPGNVPIVAISTGIPNLADTVYEYRMFADPHRTDLQVRLERFVHGRSFSVANHTYTTNLVTGFMGSLYLTMGNGAAGGVATILFRSMYVQIQPVGASIDS